MSAGVRVFFTTLTDIVMPTKVCTIDLAGACFPNVSSVQKQKAERETVILQTMTHALNYKHMSSPKILYVHKSL